ncbi:peptidase M15-like protein [Arcticibacter tournemirensis]|uniref:Peptidase M15A C-terminal domain-containing protein n=1 Tax=Arcticibacter tournemirensis TaxID=699437 RepID=A0A5M9HDS4_9SPHI|nr:D-Ala-D-Ala carboxypeptidase family metallohydrolase [Arcticibacter tournemirensis]KAA8483761.1 hypothetical protein F1649_07690 [Arcticibacter tournemirensis]TQM50038.1 peptidase M15-like protein [Arcticibacter tournemirensis]
MENISKHISWGEATSSPTAKARGIVNVPDAATISRMKHVALNIFEKVREHFALPIKVTSFFRSAALNIAIGGSKTSQHCLGEAIDMDGDVYGSPSNAQIFEFVRDNLVFDQLIVEGIVNGQIAWVHCSLKATGNRKQITFMYHSKAGKVVPSGTPGAKKVYEPYTESRYKALVYPKRQVA